MVCLALALAPSYASISCSQNPISPEDVIERTGFFINPHLLTKEAQDLLTKEMFEFKDWTSFCLREMNFIFACNFLASNLACSWPGKQQWAAACRGLR